MKDPSDKEKDPSFEMGKFLNSQEFLSPLLYAIVVLKSLL
jgi:hypothetical protein